MARLVRLCLLAAALAWVPELDAQQYSFTVERMRLEVFINPDASARLKYTMVFRNFGSPIDIVDVGLPHRDYDLSNMRAKVDGGWVGGIRPSTYISVGVEVPLGGRQIPNGKSGTFEFECTMPDMVYQDTTDKTYASFQIKPTWFDPKLQRGKTRLEVAIHLPPGIQAEQVRYQSEKTRYQDLARFGEGDAEHIVAAWQLDSVTLSSKNPKFAISFPKAPMQRVVTMSAIELLIKWFVERPNIRFIHAILVLVLWTYAFFRFSHGTGFVLYLLVAAGVGFAMYASPGGQLLLLPTMLGLAVAVEWWIRRKRLRYFPAAATVEGGGIKRGLTAPQAAVLLELPLNRVLTLVLFGLLKKQVVKVEQSEPLQVRVDPEFVCPRKQRIAVAGKRGIVLHDYEQPFLDALQGKDLPVEEHDFSSATSKLIQSVVERMKGFDLESTRNYYRSIIQRAWTEAEGLEFQQRQRAVDRNLEWMMMDDEWSGRFGRWGSRGYHYRPLWIPTHRSSNSGGSQPSPASGGSEAPTSLSEVASSFVGWTENTAGSLVSTIEPARMNLGGSAGIVDLSGVDQMTADFFEALNNSSGGRGGGGGGCACACAGCACACACAGGGR